MDIFDKLEAHPEYGRPRRRKAPPTETLDQDMLSSSFLDAFGAENLLSDSNGIWQWDEMVGVWRKADDREIRGEVQKHLRSLSVEQANAKVNISHSQVVGVSELVENQVYSPRHVWNSNRTIANFQNGELSWDGVGFVLSEHHRANYSTIQVPHHYNPDATCPRFEQFLVEIFEGDEDIAAKQAALLEMIGYTLFAQITHQRMILLLGSGANGKSVMLTLLEGLIGRANVSAVQLKQLDNRFQRAHLEGKLANIVTEIGEGEQLPDAELKAVVAGEVITAEHKNKPPFEYTPTAKFWCGANHLPHTRDTSNALFRRMLILGFNRTFAGSAADPNLAQKLLAESSGIIILALNAYAKVLETGVFTEPASSEALKAEWRVSVDQVAQFVEEECVRCAESSEGSSSLYSHYQYWAKQNGIQRVVSQATFVQRLEKLGFTSERTSSHRRIGGLKRLYDSDDTTFDNVTSMSAPANLLFGIAQRKSPSLPSPANAIR